jgi:hypothetical protein
MINENGNWKENDKLKLAIGEEESLKFPVLVKIIAEDKIGGRKEEHSGDK